SWSLPTRRLATKTSKLEKKEVPGAANTTPRKPRGNSSTTGGSEEASIGSGSIGSKIFLATEFPALSTAEGGGTVGEPSKRPLPLEWPAPSTDGGGGTTSEPAPESEANLVPPAGPPEPSTDGGGGTICEPFPEPFPDPFPDNEPKRPRAPEWPAPSKDGGGGTTSEPESEPNLVPPAELPAL